MADQSEVQEGASPREEIAWRLMERIALVEDKRLFHDAQGKSASREWVLHTYSQCLKAVTDPDYFLKR